MRFARRNWTGGKTGMTIGVSMVFAALRPLMAMWYLWVRDGWTNVAHAIDAPHAVQAGDGLDRILLLGGHTSAGFGVLTHQIGLVGALSRQLSKSTGRGVEVQAIADVGMTLRALAPQAREMPALWADAVLVTVGINDALRLTPVGAWREQLRTLIEVIRERTECGTPILIVEIPPAVMVWDFARVPARIATSHARALNAESQMLCRSLPHTTYVPFNPSQLEGIPNLIQWRAAMYTEWSMKFVATIAEALHREPE